MTKDLFFSFEAAISVNGEMDVLAVPSIAINWRAFNPKKRGGWAAQLLLGGALNPSNGDASATAALGFGLGHPIGTLGSLSFGAFLLEEEDAAMVSETKWRPFVAINLGDFAMPATK